MGIVPMKTILMKFSKVEPKLPVVALLVGIAVGAAFGILFAPKSKSRSKHATTTKPIPDLRAHSLEVSEKLTGSPDQIPDLTKTTLKQTGPKSRQLPIES